MTAGNGIAHAEETPPKSNGVLNGAQLWVALPEARRKISPAFQHIEKVPAIDLRGGVAQVFAGTLVGATSPAEHYSDIIGADLAASGAELTLPLNPSHEHALLLLEGDSSDCMGRATGVRRS